jgi:hypothetical protein
MRENKKPAPFLCQERNRLNGLRKHFGEEMLIRPSQFFIYDDDKMVVLLFHHCRLCSASGETDGRRLVKFIINNRTIIVNNEKNSVEKGAYCWLRYCDFTV